MTIIRWQPWQDVELVRRQLDQLFDEFAPVTRVSRTPAVELKTTETDVIVRAEVPGIDAKDLNVEATRNAIAIAGEFRSDTQADEHGYYRSEFRYGNFRRVVPLPVEVQHDRVTASFKDGILTLTLPKLVADDKKIVKVTLTEPPETTPNPSEDGNPVA